MLTKQEKMLNNLRENESYESYYNRVLTRARQLKPGSLCLDTISKSFAEAQSVDEAARRVVDETGYWEYYG